MTFIALHTYTYAASGLTGFPLMKAAERVSFSLATTGHGVAWATGGQGARLQMPGHTRIAFDLPRDFSSRLSPFRRHNRAGHVGGREMREGLSRDPHLQGMSGKWSGSTAGGARGRGRRRR